MKGKRIYIVLLVVYVALMVLISVLQPKEINWTPTFSSQDKIPYGDYVLFKQLKDIFPGQEVHENTVSLYQFVDDSVFDDHEGTRKANFITVNSAFNADDMDVEEMLRFVDAGNSVFIASAAVSNELTDTLGIVFSDKLSYPGSIKDIDSGLRYSMNFTNPGLRTQGGYYYKRDYLSHEIRTADSAENKTELFAADTLSSKKHYAFTVLGTDDAGKTNFVKVPIGKGNLFLHSYPLAFTNYYMLKGNNHEYVEKCLSYLPKQETYWDENYKPGKVRKAQTPMRYILSVPAYKWAYYLLLLAVFIYVLFAIKREQRIIPIIEPYPNLSLEFTRTIGTLYFQQHNNRDLAEKKMIYFLERVRNNYFLNTNLLDEQFLAKLALKSGVGKDMVEEIFKIYLWQIKKGGPISDKTLIDFNAALEKFYAETGINNK